MKILGIDPALSITGWAIITGQANNLQYLTSGVIKTNNASLIHNRLANIANKIEEIIITHQPQIVAMEETFINSNAVSSLKLGYVRGAIMSLVGKYEISLQEFKPNHIKKTVTGAGHANKQQMVKMINLLIPATINIQKFDEADAVGVAYTCLIDHSCKTSINYLT